MGASKKFHVSATPMSRKMLGAYYELYLIGLWKPVATPGLKGIYALHLSASHDTVNPLMQEFFFLSALER